VNEISQLNTDVWLPDLPNSDTDEKGVEHKLAQFPNRTHLPSSTGYGRGP